MTQSKVISILLPHLRGGGAERVQLVLAKEFAKLGHRPEFVLKQAVGDLLPEAQSLFPVKELGCKHYSEVVPAVTNYIRNDQPDCLLAAMWPLTVHAASARRESKINCSLAISEHNVLSLKYKNRDPSYRRELRWRTAIGYRLADARIAVSDGVARDLARLSFMRRKRFQVIYNPLWERPAPSAEDIRDAEQIWGDAKFRILSVGRFNEVKNNALLLRAFAKIRLENVRLVLLGQGELQDELEALAKSLGIEQNVVFAGFRSDPTAFYKTANLFVLSSNQEGFGNVLVEAFHSGTPVVSTDCPYGPAEILKNGRYGALVPVGDAEALAGAMVASLSKHHDRERLRERARDFHPEQAARAYLRALGIN